jgi:hypothetical protein
MNEKPVPHREIPSDGLPPARYRDLPEAPSWRKLVGPSVLLLGLALGSGEFVLWPYITYKYGFTIFWACMLGVTTQYFINMEVERWTLATGETAITGFCRLWKHWAWIFLACNVIPWMWPGWASGAATLLTWEIGGNENVRVLYSILSLILAGLALTLGPVVYNTVERIQMVLVSCILVFLGVIFYLVVDLEHIVDMFKGVASIGHIPDDINMQLLLGAVAFAGAGGTMNLAQSDFIRDKGYAMGAYIGRIMSPLSGKGEVVSGIGYHFVQTDDNMRRWRAWWKAANIEHLLTFFLLSVVSLMLLSLIAYAATRGTPGLERGIGFIAVEGAAIGRQYGTGFQHFFHWMGIAILLTTELGILDAGSRISTGIVKVNWLRKSEKWTDQRLYFVFLWGQIGLGCAIMLVGLVVEGFNQPLVLLVLSASMNGGVMLLYSILLFWMNNRVLRGKIVMGTGRKIAILWACMFFGYFTIMTLISELPKLWR